MAKNTTYVVYAYGATNSANSDPGIVAVVSASSREEALEFARAEIASGVRRPLYHVEAMSALPASKARRR